MGNPKNPISSFSLTGYMPDEVYSFGIVYVTKDGTKSPAYHIPGVPFSTTPVVKEVKYGVLYNKFALVDIVPDPSAVLQLI